MIPDGHTVVNMLSGGAGSWAAGRRLVDTYGPGRVTNLFTDVKGSDGNPHTGEHPDTYRFLHDAADDLGCEFIYLQDGRDIWDIFDHKSWLGNSSLSHCSWFLKTLPARRWLDENRDPATTWVSVGMDWTETDRHAGVHRNYGHTTSGCVDSHRCGSLWTRDGRIEGPGTCRNVLTVPWRVLMPMNDKPRYAKPQVLRLMRERGLTPPLMYEQGFPHANCPACVKGGQAHWRRLLEVDPESFAYAEEREARFQAGAPHRATATILSETVAGVSRPLPLTELRRRVETAQDEQPSFDLKFDWGGCGCANEPAPPDVSDPAGTLDTTPTMCLN